MRVLDVYFGCFWVSALEGFSDEGPEQSEGMGRVSGLTASSSLCAGRRRGNLCWMRVAAALGGLDAALKRTCL